MSSSGSQNQQPEIHQARNYVARVKSSLGETSTQYKLFLSTLKSYRTRQLTPLEVISRISNLFRNCNDNEELILGFNAFLPPEYQISEEGLLRRNQEVEADAIVIDDGDDDDDYHKATATSIQKQQKESSLSTKMPKGRKNN